MKLLAKVSDTFLKRLLFIDEIIHKYSQGIIIPIFSM